MPSSQTDHRTLSTQVARLGVPSLTLAVVCFLIWWPFGFRLTGLLEEWDVLGQFGVGGVFFIAGADTPLHQHQLRPLTILPHAMAFWLDPDSFDYWHAILILSVFGKGFACWLLIRRATGISVVALACALLLVLYPADTMQLSFRGLHINFALALGLLAVAMHGIAEDREKPSQRYAVALLAGALLLFAALMYEVAITLIVLPFLLGVCRNGFRAYCRKTIRRRAPMCLWLLGAAAYVTYLMWLPPMQKQSYQATLSAGRPAWEVILAALPRLFDPGLVRTSIGGWIDAWGMFHQDHSLYALLAGLALSGALWICARNARASDSTVLTPSFSVKLAVVGTVMAALGFIPYLVSATHIAITQRTYLFASVGGAIFLVALLTLLSRASKVLAWLVTATLLVLGMAAQIHQFQHYVTLSEQQRKILKSVVENVPPLDPDQTLVIEDRSGHLGHLWMLRVHLAYALSYFYNQPIENVMICLTQRRDWQHLDALVRPGRCEEEDREWRFLSATPVSGPGLAPMRAIDDVVVDKRNVVRLTLQADGHVIPDPVLDTHRQQLKSGQNELSRRYRRILASHREFDIAPRLNPAHDDNAFEWAAGRWWNLDLPIRGSGWREAEWEGPTLRRHASVWKTQEIASLLFELRPENPTYLLDGEFSVVLNESIKNSIRLRLNGHTVDLTWAPPFKFGAAVPKSMLVDGTNLLEIESVIDNTYYGLSTKLQSVRLHPR